MSRPTQSDAVRPAPQPLGAARRPIIATDGETRPALAVTRSLGRRGHAVTVLAGRARSLAGSSRHARGRVQVPSAEYNAPLWLCAVEAVLRTQPDALLIPITEVAIGTLFDSDLPGRFAVALPPEQAYARVADKSALVERAAELGVRVPRSELIRAGAALRDLPGALRYPVVVKSRRSRWRAGSRWQSGSAFAVRGRAELAALQGHPALADGFLLQEFIPGRGEGVSLLFDRGQLRAVFAHRRVREKPPRGGVSVLSESIPVDPELLAWSERLLVDVGWHGVAMVELRRHPDGRAFLMEINPRLWGSLQLAIDAGLDFPALLVDLYEPERKPEPAAVRPARAAPGVRLRWEFGDLDHLWIALRRPAERSATGRSAPRVCADFLRSFFDGSLPEVLRLDDPGPFLCELRERF